MKRAHGLGIILFLLPRNCNHILQGEDLINFGIFKTRTRSSTTSKKYRISYIVLKLGKRREGGGARSQNRGGGSTRPRQATYASATSCPQMHLMDTPRILLGLFQHCACLAPFMTGFKNSEECRLEGCELLEARTHHAPRRARWRMQLREHKSSSAPSTRQCYRREKNSYVPARNCTSN